MQVLAGTLSADCGVLLARHEVRSSYNVQMARQHGIRCVFQELSLCPNLSVAENLQLMSPAIRGWGWRRQAKALIDASLDEIFPAMVLQPTTSSPSCRLASGRWLRLPVLLSRWMSAWNW
jgi:ABC-type sugar transport system ATPase subunit